MSQTGPRYVYNFARKRRSADNFEDASKPNYRPEWWRPSAYHWDRTLDWCGFLEDPAFKECYLCDVPGELTPDRAARIDADSPEPYFKDAVKDHASIFSQFELAGDAPATLAESEDNVDLSGTDIWQWVTSTNVALFRDGGALLGADIPPVVTDQEMRMSRSPRLLWVPMRDVYWPEYRNIGGVDVFAKISIRRGKTKAGSKGELKAYNEYWVYELDEMRRCTLTVWTEEDEKFVEGEPVFIRGASAANDGTGLGQPLDRLPFTDKFSFLGDLNLNDERQLMSPFADVLNLNIEHYNARSEYNAVKRKTMPTPLRKWPNGVPDSPPPFYAGPSKCIDIDADGDAGYIEIQGKNLPELRQGISDIEKKIEARNNKLFSVAGGRSATEADIENQKAKAGYPGVKMLIESAFQDLFSVWELFANPSPAPVGGIVISESVLQSPPSPQDLPPLFNSVAQGVPVEAIVRKAVRDGHFEAEDFAGTPFEAVLKGDALNIPAVPVDESEVIQ